MILGKSFTFSASIYPQGAEGLAHCRIQRESEEENSRGLTGSGISGECQPPACPGHQGCPGWDPGHRAPSCLPAPNKGPFESLTGRGKLALPTGLFLSSWLARKERDGVWTQPEGRGPRLTGHSQQEGMVARCTPGLWLSSPTPATAVPTAVPGQLSCWAAHLAWGRTRGQTAALNPPPGTFHSLHMVLVIAEAQLASPWVTVTTQK